MAIILIIILSAMVSLVYLNLVYNDKVNKNNSFIKEWLENMKFYTINNSNRIISIENTVTDIKKEFTNKQKSYNEQLDCMIEIQTILEVYINNLDKHIKDIKAGNNKILKGDNVEVMKKQLRYMKSYNSALKERIKGITESYTNNECKSS